MYTLLTTVLFFLLCVCQRLQRQTKCFIKMMCINEAIIVILTVLGKTKTADLMIHSAVLSSKNAFGQC